MGRLLLRPPPRGGRRRGRRMEGRYAPCGVAAQDGRSQGFLLGKNGEGLGHRELPAGRGPGGLDVDREGAARRKLHRPDRKSTRLNSSHSQISYAVFCLKKKKKKKR